MSVLTEILDRLSGIAALRESIATLREKLNKQDQTLDGMQRIMLDQQREIAELRGMMKGMIEVQKRIGK
jgi:uncharacterized coiled-coil protein SlyX